MASARVLVIEDTELLRRMYRDRLVDDGYEVLEAADGLAALAVLQNEAIDLILLDLIMPRMGGVQLLESVKHNPRTQHIPVIVLTNLGEEETVEHAISLGAVDCLIKNETRPGDVSLKVQRVLKETVKPAEEPSHFLVYVRPDAGDVDRLVSHAGLKRRLWCPACESELALQLVPDPKRPGWYAAQFMCPGCGRTFTGPA